MGNTFRRLSLICSYPCRYPLRDFLGASPCSGPSTRLHQCVLYLSPGDYHGFHSPADWRVHCRRHFDGLLLSVGPRVVKAVGGALFTGNERVSYLGQWREGDGKDGGGLFLSMTAVGATNVGSVVVPADPELATNDPAARGRGLRRREPKTKEFSKPLLLKRGDFFGEFNLGSSIVLVFETGPEEELTFTVQPGQKVKMGQSIAKICDQVERKNG